MPAIAALVTELGFANGTALRPAEWKARSIHPGDRVELLRLAAGG